jgi:hypothetical protein
MFPTRICFSLAPLNPLLHTNLFNYSITTETFPSEWKIAKVTLFINQGLEICSIISILPTISKIFEKILYRQIFTYFNTNIISKYQFGFRPNHSTADALLHSTNEWYTNLDRGMFNIAVFLDLKKAFDTINHKILTSKLGFYGFEPSALNFISSYLGNRSQ